MKPKLAIFDLDGTLLDSLQDLAESANVILESRGFPTYPIPDYAHFVGDGARTLIERILPPDHRDSLTVDQCLENYYQEYERRWNRHTAIYAGIPELLQMLADLGTLLAVLSNKPHGFTQQCVATLCPPPAGATWARVLGLRAGKAKKPDPSSALEIAESLHIAPHETWYFGDTDTDMQTAVNAGFHAFGVLWGFRDEEELRANGAHAILRHPTDLKNFVSELD